MICSRNLTQDWISPAHANEGEILQKSREAIKKGNAVPIFESLVSDMKKYLTDTIKFKHCKTMEDFRLALKEKGQGTLDSQFKLFIMDHLYSAADNARKIKCFLSYGNSLPNISHTLESYECKMRHLHLL